MKKVQFILYALLLSTVTINAQKKKTTKKTPQKIQFGVKAGANLSKISGVDVNYDYNYKLGYYGGLIAKYSIAPKFDIQAELFYDKKGTRMQTKNNGRIKNGHLNMPYITLPVMAQLKVSRKFYLEAGPEFSYMVDSKLNDKGTGETYEWKDRTKKFITAFDFGAGYYITNDIAINLRTNIAMGTPIAKTTDLDVSKLKMNGFQLGLNYYF